MIIFIPRILRKNFQMAQSFKETLDGWNTLTGEWLRQIAYERAPKNIRTLSTYVLSAVWHGVSVGYYMTFMTGALMTLAGSTVRFFLFSIRSAHVFLFRKISKRNWMPNILFSIQMTKMACNSYFTR